MEPGKIDRWRSYIYISITNPPYIGGSPMPKRTVHKSITKSRIERAVTDTFMGLGNSGFCLACGKEDDIEPDATAMKCNHCDELALFGASSIGLALFAPSL